MTFILQQEKQMELLFVHFKVYCFCFFVAKFPVSERKRQYVKRQVLFFLVGLEFFF
uniref:Uncharacterized protein n=1 Tax=Anguilla anguilla TaxID=7936 RepID=A0A0E9WYE0_ANGAN